MILIFVLLFLKSFLSNLTIIFVFDLFSIFIGFPNLKTSDILFNSVYFLSCIKLLLDNLKFIAGDWDLLFFTTFVFLKVIFSVVLNFISIHKFKKNRIVAPVCDLNFFIQITKGMHYLVEINNKKYKLFTQSLKKIKPLPLNTPRRHSSFKNRFYGYIYNKFSLTHSWSSLF